LGPAAFVMKAILAALFLNVSLLAFILVRRSYRKRYFAKRDAKVFEIRQNWSALISGKIPYETWRTKAFARTTIEAMVLDAFEPAGPDESARLLRFLRASGLLERQISEARARRGWRRHRALVALGRTRAPEAIPALAEGLRDRMLETRLASLRGLERMACPEAAKAILDWVAGEGICVPGLPLQTALIQCCAERPQVLLPYLRHTETATREVLGRVLGEVATVSVASELLPFADDALPEIRAAAARAMSQADPRQAIEVLSQLAEDSVWYVRLRAVVSLGKLGHQSGIPPLLRGLCDSNRLVRLRAAEGLVNLKAERLSILEKVVATHDRYALYAYLTAIDNAGLQPELEARVRSAEQLSEPARTVLLDVVHTGSLPSRDLAEVKTSAATAAH